MRYLLLALLLTGCFSEDTITNNRIVENQPLDEFDIENLRESFYNQCRSIYSKYQPINKRADKIKKCTEDSLQPFIDKYKEDINE